MWTLKIIFANMYLLNLILYCKPLFFRHGQNLDRKLDNIKGERRNERWSFRGVYRKRSSQNYIELGVINIIMIISLIQRKYPSQRI